MPIAVRDRQAGAGRVGQHAGQLRHLGDERLLAPVPGPRRGRPAADDPGDDAQHAEHRREPDGEHPADRDAAADGEQRRRAAGRRSSRRAAAGARPTAGPGRDGTRGPSATEPRTCAPTSSLTSTATQRAATGAVDPRSRDADQSSARPRAGEQDDEHDHGATRRPDAVRGSAPGPSGRRSAARPPGRSARRRSAACPGSAAGSGSRTNPPGGPAASGARGPSA